MCLLIFPLLKIGHDAVHNVWLRGEEVEGLDIAVGGAAVGDLLDVWSKSGHLRRFESVLGGARTRDVLVQKRILFDYVLQQLLAVGVEHEDFPLRRGVRHGCCKVR